MTRIAADKRFGQHFLVNEGIVERIAASVQSLAQADGAAAVLEIGPGPGALTRALLGKGLRVLAVELDVRMVELLEREFAEPLASGAFQLLRGDALRVSLAEIESRLPPGPVVVCGNLPYNVGSQIVFRYFEEWARARSFCYMLQKEVVLKFLSGFDRTLGDRRDYGPPGIKLAWASEGLGHFWVGPGSFRPPPKVESGVFSFRRLPPERALADALERGGRYDEAASFVAKVFSQRRKMMKALIKPLAATEWGTCRAEELSPQDLFELSARLRALAGSNPAE